MRDQYARRSFLDDPKHQDTGKRQPCTGTHAEKSKTITTAQIASTAYDLWQSAPILNLDLHSRAYKLQAVQAMTPADKVARIQFCDEFLEMWATNPGIVDNLLMSDEHISCYPGQ